MSEADDELQYDVMVENALRGVVRQALTHAAQRGLPGEHHFYVTFRTDHPGVVIAQRLHERYPEDMTIVLQHQFWDLEVAEESFGVNLSFDNRSERLIVPFDAVVAFADPSVRFGLQFEVGEGDAEARDEAEGPLAPDTADSAKTSGGTDGDSDSDSGGGGDGNVVTLDRFRKT